MLKSKWIKIKFSVPLRRRFNMVTFNRSRVLQRIYFKNATWKDWLVLQWPDHFWIRSNILRGILRSIAPLVFCEVMDPASGKATKIIGKPHIISEKSIKIIRNRKNKFDYFFGYNIFFSFNISWTFCVKSIFEERSRLIFFVIRL